KIYRWTGDFGRNPFAEVENAWGIHLDVAPDGSAWLALDRGQVVHMAGDERHEVPLDGAARDITVGADGKVYVVGVAGDGAPALFEYSAESGRFVRGLAIDAERVSAGPSRVVAVLRD